MYIRLEYSFNQHILIKLFDNSASRSWFKKYANSNYEYETDRQYFNSRFNFLKRLDPRNRHHWASIQTTLKKIKDLNFNIPFSIPDNFDYNQSTLNQLHRFFTYNVLWYFKKDSISNPFDPKFQTAMSFEQWHGLLDPINLSVHYLESSTLVNTRQIFSKFPINSLIYRPTNLDFSTWMDFTAEEQLENFNFFNYSENTLVLLNESILGKSILRSFVDNDDPTFEDCTGRIGSHGGIVIDFDDNRKHVYQSTEFKSWISKFNLKNLPLEFPIGYVVNSNKQFLRFIIPKLQLKSVTFLNGGS